MSKAICGSVFSIMPTHQRNAKSKKSCDTICWGSYNLNKLKTPGINHLPCTVDVSNKAVDIRPLKDYRCAIIITRHQKVHN